MERGSRGISGNLRWPGDSVIQRGCMAPMEKYNFYKRSYRECIRKENMPAENTTETELLGRSTARCLTLCISLIQKTYPNCFGTTLADYRKNMVHNPTAKES